MEEPYTYLDVSKVGDDLDIKVGSPVLENELETCHDMGGHAEASFLLDYDENLNYIDMRLSFKEDKTDVPI